MSSLDAPVSMFLSRCRVSLLCAADPPRRPPAPPRTAPVPDFLPFRAIRYAGGPVLDAVCAPPYDVIDARARDALLAADPHNAVRLILPDSYTAAAATL